MGGGVTPWAEAPKAIQARTAAIVLFMGWAGVLAGADGGIHAERRADFLGDGVRFIAGAVGPQAHAVQAVALQDGDRLEHPGELALGVLAEALRAFGAGERAQLQ